MKPNLFSMIKTFFQFRFAKRYTLMTKENTTTDRHGLTRMDTDLESGVLENYTQRNCDGFGIMLGKFGTEVMAVAVTGIKTWSSNDKLTANDLNTTITSLKTAIESMPNWTKNGTSAYHIDGNVEIATRIPQSGFHILGAGQYTAIISTTIGLGVSLLLQDSESGANKGGSVLFGDCSGY